MSVPDGYVLVKSANAFATTVVKIDEKDSKVNPVVRPLRSGLAKGTVGKLNNIKTHLVWTGTATSANNTALTTVVTIDPTLATEWTKFNSIYDEVRTLSGKIFWSVEYAATPGTSNNAIDAAVMFDPMDNSAAASVAETLIASQHMGPMRFRLLGGTSNPYVVGPTSENKSGYHQFKFKIPKGPQTNTANGGWAGSNWTSTVNADSIAGYVKFIINSAGTSTPSTLIYYVVVQSEFRSRQ